MELVMNICERILVLDSADHSGGMLEGYRLTSECSKYILAKGRVMEQKTYSSP
jgi:hypothetical protein